MTTRAPDILIYDSGLGGLTVYREIAKALPGARYRYVADDAVFPIGELADETIIARVDAVLAPLIAARAPDVIVIACNTASTLVLPPLRARYAHMPFVGTVPAVKPAAERSRTRVISVLATPGTVKRDYTRDLVETFANHCEVKLVGSRRLATLAEEFARGHVVADEDIRAEIAPCFVERNGERTDHVVLACTHYPLILEKFRELAPWPVEWVDPAPAIARQVERILAAKGFAGAASMGASLGEMILTSGKPCDDALKRFLAGFNLAPRESPRASRSTPMPTNKAFVLASRPTRENPAGPHNFKLVESEAPELREGDVLVRNHYLSLDPYQRGRMNDGPSYAAPQPLGEAMTGRTVGEVIASKNPRFAVGDFVILTGGWQLIARSDGRDMRRIDVKAAPMEAYLGSLGMPGATAWYGVNEIIKPKAGETVVVSAATGAVGTVAGQLAKMAGARVVGVAGGLEKCAYARDALGYDECVDHRAENFAEAFKAAVPKGIDGLFENVGGAPFQNALKRLNPFSRVAICGLVASGYDGTPTQLPDMRTVLNTRCTIRGFIISDHMELWPRALGELASHAKAGDLKWRQSVAQGLEAAPEAFFSMLKGGNFGKQLVKLV